jgi:hypothetical protein
MTFWFHIPDEFEILFGITFLLLIVKCYALRKVEKRV